MRKTNFVWVLDPDCNGFLNIPRAHKVVVAASGAVKGSLGQETRFLPIGGGTMEFFRSDRKEALEVINRASAAQNIYVTFQK